MRLLKQFVAVAAVALIGSMGVGAVQGNPLLTLILGVATAALAVFVYARVVRWSQRREPVEVAAKGATAVGRGVLIGVGMFATVIVNIAFLGGYRIDGFGSATGPALLTGGGFGPEASPYAVVFGALLILVFMWLARRRGNLVPRRRDALAGMTATLSQ
ncbi:hypothetical protein ABZ897_07965 [Nonomuraea sp. NPDC046802]|uniref:hypothetical protein n=1 Tax=Nonomuraea sp. NPDC046802 TaxID=3154919 RepID=UPI003403EE44